MAIEATSEGGIETEPKPRRAPKAPRGGNPLVEQIVEGLETSTTPTAPTEPPEETIVQEARARMAPVVVEEEEPSSGPEAPEGEPYNPFTRAQAQPPTVSRRVQREENAAERQKINKQTPSTKRFGELGKKLPGAERAKVHKRVDGGSLAYIGEYDEGDLSQSQDMESFLHRYIKPAYGPGEYQITGIDAHGRAFDMGKVDLLAPVSPSALLPEQHGETPLSLVKQLVDNALKQQQQPQQRDPIKMLGELHELKSRMDPPPTPPKEKDNNLLIAIVGGLTTVASSLVTVLAQPKPPDPMMQLLMAKLLDDSGKKSEPMPPMPPPPPAVDPTEQLKNLAAVVQSLRGETTAVAKDDRLVDYLMKERMTPGEVLALVNQVKGERGTDDFKKSMENIGIMLNAVTQLRSHTEPGAGAGFWDAIGALVSNKELAGTVVDAVRGRVSQRQPEQQLPPPQQRPMLPANDPVVMKARELAERRLVLEEQEIIRREQAQGVTPKAIVTAPPVHTAPVAPVTAPPPPPAPGLQKIPQLPGNIADFVNSYIEAKDDEAALVGTTVEMLFSLGENAEWKAYADVIFSLLANSDRGRFLNYMASFFINIKAIGLIEEKLAERVMQALANNFVAIVESVKEQLEKNESEGEDEDEEGEEEDEEDLLKLGEEQPLPE